MKPSAIATLILLLAALPGCGATNTGNPSEPNEPVDAPEGVELLKSALERETAPALGATEREQVGRDSREFALDLYAETAPSTGNAFISPYSVSVALAMTYAGAAGETKSEMMSALHFNLPEPDLHAAWNAVDAELEGRASELAGGENETGEPMSSGDGLQLEVTNAVFAQRGFTPKQPFLDTLALHYGAGLYAADFANEPEVARVAINDWTAERTNDRITDLLPMHSLDGAIMVLLNAIYFKASWLDPFDPAMTQPAPFHSPDGDVMVDMMHGEAETYAAGDGYQALELPYISPDVTMFFILPDEGRFDEIEAGLNRELFDRVHGELAGNHIVDLRLPKFTIDGATVSLSDALKALGMNLAFNAGQADLSGIADADLFISDVLHQAFVALDETGTEAAAATAVIVSVTSAPPPPIPVELTFDRPFLFAVYDRPTGQILFIGRVVDPS